ncbi:Kinesin-like protein KIF13B [Oryzias melastigma]|uniref:Kinesin-like protein KIF13B n=1 Tax=Oryzias melastigma TaxID=30732 RepID=A0A834BRN8_ORYME|nr:Kinesin-like protein KIF13B [Oryzias melastigma]
MVQKTGKCWPGWLPAPRTTSRPDSDAAIEKYLRSVLSVENILTLDRLRQEVAVREQLPVRGKASLSSPDVHRLFSSNLDLRTSTYKLSNLKAWDSHQDLCGPPSSRRTNTETTHSGFASSYLPPVTAVPRLLKSLLPGGKGDGGDQTSAHQQSLPRIVVQSASVEEDLSNQQQQQPVPVEESIPADVPTENHTSVPLPPPIIPDVDDLSSCLVSDSGYMSTSVSTATLSDVYTLSWDLPPSCGGKAGDFEEEPDEEEMGRGMEKLSADSPEPGESGSRL